MSDRQTILQAIDDSIMQDRIVTLKYTDDLRAELFIEADDIVDTEYGCEAWNIPENEADGWRIHLAK